MDKRYRIDIAFYVDAETVEDALHLVEDGISANLARDYDYIDGNEAL